MRVFVRLLNEGTEVARPVQALDLGGGLFKILATIDYDILSLDASFHGQINSASSGNLGQTGRFR